MYTKDFINQQLKNLGAPQDRIVLVHSSLRAIGEIDGRGEGLIDIFIEYFTAKGGLLCIPTHTWANISDENRITLDLKTPETCIGTLPNIAANHPDAIRSMHPTHSMAVFGNKELALEFVSGEENFVTPADPDGCYGKIFKNDGFVLLVGVGHNRNTYIHCVEEMLGISNRLSKSPKTATIRYKDGKTEKRIVYPHDAVGIGDVSLRYPMYEQAFRHHGCICDGNIGNAQAQLCSARKMKEVIELIYARSGKIDVLATKTEIDKSLYM